jgi:hypothetical protein
MNYIFIPLVLFIVAVVSFFALKLWEKQLQYSDSDTQQKCTSMHLTNVKEGDDCGVWNGTQCKRGTIRNGRCIEKFSIIQTLLFLLFFLSSILGLYSIIHGVLLYNYYGMLPDINVKDVLKNPDILFYRSNI